MVMPWPGQYSCLQVDFTFARQVIFHRPHELNTNINRELSFYIISIYLPCSMIVVVSWFSFWIDLNSVSTYQTIPRKWGTMYFRHQPVFPWQSPPYWQCPLRWPAYRWRENSTQNQKRIEIRPQASLPPVAYTKVLNLISKHLKCCFVCFADVVALVLFGQAKVKKEC